MKMLDRAKAAPQIGHSSERLVEDRRIKSSFKVQAGSAICQRCGAVSYQKHWFYDEAARTRVQNDQLARMVLCPGCKRIEDGIIDGEIVLDGDVLHANEEMFYGTVYHVAARAFLSNPLSRVATISVEGKKILIKTTTRSLANRIGKAIHKAFKGELETHSAPGDRLLRLYWHHK